MSSTTTRKYAINDMVRIPDGPGYGTIVGTSVTADHRRAEGASGTGPLYLVNEGNVFTDYAEAVYAESELQPWDEAASATSTTTETNPVYQAMDVLWQARHRLSSDVLRSLHNIWICASAARFGEPYEHWTWEENVALCREHDTAECEAPPPPRKCEGCEQLLADDDWDWFCKDCMTAASKAF